MVLNLKGEELSHQLAQQEMKKRMVEKM